MTPQNLAVTDSSIGQMKVSFRTTVWEQGEAP